jgi:hypothetical protein
MWEQSVGDLTAKCVNNGNGFYVVTVAHPKSGTERTKSFPQQYPHHFGMDIVDNKTSIELAEELSVRIEKYIKRNKLT